MKVISSVLLQQPFFEEISTAFLERISDYTSEESFSSESYIFHAGEKADKFYLIKQGKVALELLVPGASPVTLTTLDRNDALGWSWLFPPYRWQFSARSIEPTELITFDAEGLRTLCNTNHSLGYDLMQRVARVMQERLQATRLQLLDIYGVHR